jgi:hypothetical protein
MFIFGVTVVLYFKKGHNACRFNFPLPPMPRTMILDPLSETELEEVVANKL